MLSRRPRKNVHTTHSTLAAKPRKVFGGIGAIRYNFLHDLQTPERPVRYLSDAPAEAQQQRSDPHRVSAMRGGRGLPVGIGRGIRDPPPRGYGIPIPTIATITGRIIWGYGIVRLSDRCRAGGAIFRMLPLDCRLYMAIMECLGFAAPTCPVRSLISHHDRHAWCRNELTPPSHYPRRSDRRMCIT
jgi:hypothetical protein